MHDSGTSTLKQYELSYFGHEFDGPYFSGGSLSTFVDPEVYPKYFVGRPPTCSPSGTQVRVATTALAMWKQLRATSLCLDGIILNNTNPLLGSISGAAACWLNWCIGAIWLSGHPV